MGAPMTVEQMCRRLLVIGEERSLILQAPPHRSDRRRLVALDAEAEKLIAEVVRIEAFMKIVSADLHRALSRESQSAPDWIAIHRDNNELRDKVAALERESELVSELLGFNDHLQRLHKTAAEFPGDFEAGMAAERAIPMAQRDVLRAVAQVALLATAPPADNDCAKDDQ